MGQLLLCSSVKIEKTFCYNIRIDLELTPILYYSLELKKIFLPRSYEKFEYHALK